MERRQGIANIKFHRETKVDPEKLMRLVGKTSGAQFTPPDGLDDASQILGRLRERFEELAR